MIIKSYYNELSRNCKMSKSKTDIILSKMIFFSLKKGGAHFQYA